MKVRFFFHPFCIISFYVVSYSVPGAARNEDAYDTQRAVYTGWKCLHGVKMLSVVLPNGLQVFHGPISARQNDIASVHLSGLDLYLQNLQQNLQYLIQLQPGNKCFAFSLQLILLSNTFHVFIHTKEITSSIACMVMVFFILLPSPTIASVPTIGVRSMHL
jgi:hypothetical protein